MFARIEFDVFIGDQIGLATFPTLEVLSVLAKVTYWKQFWEAPVQPKRGCKPPLP